MRMQGRIDRGFTLIELLIVIAVVLLLMSMLLPMIPYMLKKSRVNKTKNDIHTLEMAANSYRNSIGVYPPSQSSELGLALGTNEGIECLVLCITSKNGGPFGEIKESQIENTDGDSGTNPTNSSLASSAGSVNYYEVVDAWLQPIVYIRANQYAAGGGLYLKSAGGDTYTATTAKGKTGGNANAMTFQLRSIGADQQIDTDDDITNWGAGD